MDKANNALQLIAEGKLNLVQNIDNSIEIEQLKLKSFRNNLIISIFRSCNFSIIGILINYDYKDKKSFDNNRWWNISI